MIERVIDILIVLSKEVLLLLIAPTSPQALACKFYYCFAIVIVILDDTISIVDMNIMYLCCFSSQSFISALS